MFILPKAIYSFNTIPNQDTNDIHQRTKTNTSEIYVEPQKAHSNSDPEKEQNWKNHAT